MANRVSGHESDSFSTSKVIAAAVMLVVMVGSVSPGAAQTPAVSEDKPVVAVVVPLSGPLATMGQQLLEAAELAAQRVEVEVEGIDEGESSADVVSAISEAANRQDIIAIIGPTRRRHAPAAAGAASRSGVPLVVYSSLSGVERDGPWVLRGRLSAVELSERMARYLDENTDSQRIGLLAPRSDYGDDVSTAVVDAIDRRSARVVALGRYATDTTDFRPALEVLVGRRAFVGTGRQLSRYPVDVHGTVAVSGDRQREFDTLVIADFHDTVARVLPFLSEVGISTFGRDQSRVQLVGLSGWRGDGLQLASEYARGAVFFDTFGGGVDGEEAKRFETAFRNWTDRQPTTPEAEIYDLVVMIADVADEIPAGQAPRLGLVEKLRAGDSFSGVTGEWSFSATGAPVREIHPYRVVDGGNWVRVPQ